MFAVVICDLILKYAQRQPNEYEIALNIESIFFKYSSQYLTKYFKEKDGYIYYEHKLFKKGFEENIITEETFRLSQRLSINDYNHRIWRELVTFKWQPKKKWRWWYICNS